MAQRIRKNAKMIRSEYILRSRSVNAKKTTVIVALITSIIGMVSAPYRLRNVVSTKFLNRAVTKKREKQTKEIHRSFLYSF
ncbi:MAG: hypothetical protein AB7V04_03825 [Desulfomonilaceae bacterium]